MDSCRVWRFHIPETGGIQETDTAKFFPQHAVPTVSTAERIAESLEDIKEAINKPMPTHMDITESQRLCAVIDRLKEMCGGEENVVADATNGNGTTEGTTAPTTNSYQNEHQQKHRIGTRIKATEKVDGKRSTCCGAATTFDRGTGLCCVKFDDGEFEEFTDDEM